MERGLTGTYTPAVAGGVKCQAFIPNPLPPAPPLTIDNTLQQRLSDAQVALGRLDAISALLPAADLFLYSYIRKEAVMSSQIEGTQSSLNDLMLYEMEGVPGVPMDDVQEVSCYVSALTLGVQRIREGYPITIRLVRELHQALMTHGRGANKSPGDFRQNQVWLGAHRPDEAVFVPPPANRIAECWTDFEYFINDLPETTEPVIKAALAHVQFETIHPFMDGNGRLGRLLIPLILVQANILKDPLLYLSVFFKKHRQTYYDRLQQVRLTGDWESWVRFFADAIAATANQAVQTAQQLNDLLQQDKVRLLQLGRLSGSATQILEALFRNPMINIATLRQHTGITPATIGKALDAMEQQLGIVREVTGQKRNRIYAYTAYINILNQELN
ncbi:MAG: Fic family protein [Hahellaceae bacterium]|nr:Fic family protein [Hahellaceae bacterium]